MFKVVSKIVTALYPGGQLLQDEYFRNIRERVFNEDRYKQKEDAGTYKDKKVVPSPTGFGSRWRKNNPGAGSETEFSDEEEDRTGIGSGYNDGGPADDEVGPGHTSITPDPYYAPDVLNGLFLDIKLKGSGKDDSMQGHIKHILDGPKVILPHRRHAVDKLKRR